MESLLKEYIDIISIKKDKNELTEDKNKKDIEEVETDKKLMKNLKER